MRVAIDKNGDGIIDNIVLCDSLEDAAALFPADTVLDAVESGVQIGWIADGQGGYTAPPAQEAQPKDLDALGFQLLVQQIAGMSDADVLAAYDDANLRLMWKRLEMATSVPRDAALTVSGLAAMVEFGHITAEQSAAIVAQWPTE